jgi:hypothetical protein
MRERAREEERGEILNEDGREIGWMKKIWNRKDRMEKERGGGQKEKCYVFRYINQESKSKGKHYTGCLG